MTGESLGRYRLLEKIGEGGMGVVYLAEDTQLARRVAIKLLPEEFARQPERLQRFLNEARLASSINHPNIVSIYELGESNERRFIAMEYVPGRSLRANLQSGRLALKKLLELALPAAEALARAHRAGVVHRDIKPENLLVSKDGYIKVADFGLAKLKPMYDPEATLTEQFESGPGQVAGTLAYMSPQQLQGEEVDARSDVFSFGVVLYEMGTGRSPFLHESVASTTAAILRDNPRPMHELAGDVPAELERIINKALEKEADFRYQSMDELATDLRRLRRELQSGKLEAPAKTVPSTQPRGRAHLALWVAGGVLLGTAATLSFMLLLKAPGPPAARRIIQLTSLPGLQESPAWSPDGRSIAYVSGQAGKLDIYVEQIGGGRVLKLSDSDADDAQPAWSPDGSRIAFVSARAYPDRRLSTLVNLGTWSPFFEGRNGDVWVMPAFGGPARRIAQNAYYPSWSPDGKRLVYQTLRQGNWSLWVQEFDTASAPQPLDLGGLNAEVIGQPAWSPDGKWIVFAAGGANAGFRIYSVSSGGGETRALTAEDSDALMPSWSSDGHWLLFSSDRLGPLNLWKARFENGRLNTPQQLTTGSGADLEGRLDAAGKQLAYSTVRQASDLWAYDLKTGQAERLTTETTVEDVAHPSPDGAWLAFASNRRGGNYLWLMNLKDHSLTRVTDTPSPQVQIRSHWSWDGKYLFYHSGGDIWRYEPSTGSSQRVYQGYVTGQGFCVSADDKYLVLPAGPEGIFRVELSSGKKELVGKPENGIAADAACSPDGQWIAFHAQSGNQRKIWVLPLTGGAARQLTFGDTEDAHPAWAADSRSVYFDRNHQDIFVVPLAGGEPKRVTNYRSLSIRLDYPVISPDGKKVIFTRYDKTGDIFLLENPLE